MLDAFFLNALAVLLLCFSLYVANIAPQRQLAFLDLLLSPFQVFLGWMVGAGAFLDEVFQKRKVRLFRVSLSTSTIFSLLRGGIITVVLVWILLLLLSNADPLFKQAVDSFFSFEFPPWRIVLSPFAWRFLWAMVFLIPLSYLRLPDSKTLGAGSGLRALESLLITGGVALVLGIFILFQIRYLFFTVPQASLAAVGLSTYSEYVRRGFLELSVVAALVYGVVAVNLGIFQKAKESRQLLRRLNFVLLGEILVFIIAIFRRLFLYQVEHGLTRIRVYGSLFLLTVTVLTILLIYRQYKQRIPQYWYFVEMSILACAVFLASIVRVDAVIARYFPPTVNTEIDYVYLAGLSADGMSGWKAAIQDAEMTLTEIPLASASAYTEEQGRQIVYADQAMSRVSNSYKQLVERYGTEEEKQQLSTGEQYPLESRSAPHFGEVFLDQNLGDRLAYERVKKEIPVDWFVNIRQAVNERFVSLPDDLKHRIYDRKLNAPLI